MVVFAFLPARSHDAREALIDAVDERAPATIAGADGVLEGGAHVFVPRTFGFGDDLAVEDVGTA
jgi:hypothetical protein